MDSWGLPLSGHASRFPFPPFSLCSRVNPKSNEARQPRQRRDTQKETPPAEAQLSAISSTLFPSPLLSPLPPRRHFSQVLRSPEERTFCLLPEPPSFPTQPAGDLWRPQGPALPARPRPGRRRREQVQNPAPGQRPPGAARVPGSVGPEPRGCRRADGAGRGEGGRGPESPRTRVFSCSLAWTLAKSPAASGCEPDPTSAPPAPPSLNSGLDSLFNN